MNVHRYSENLRSLNRALREIKEYPQTSSARREFLLDYLIKDIPRADSPDNLNEGVGPMACLMAMVSIGTMPTYPLVSLGSGIISVVLGYATLKFHREVKEYEELIRVGRALREDPSYDLSRDPLFRLDRLQMI